MENEKTYLQRRGIAKLTSQMASLQADSGVSSQQSGDAIYTKADVVLIVLSCFVFCMIATIVGSVIVYHVIKRKLLTKQSQKIIDDPNLYISGNGVENTSLIN